jgi:serine/threonine protein kinase
MREKQWITISPEAKDLVSRMLEVDAEQRITIEEALAHPWIKVGHLLWKREVIL